MSNKNKERNATIVKLEQSIEQLETLTSSKASELLGELNTVRESIKLAAPIAFVELASCVTTPTQHLRLSPCRKSPYSLEVDVTPSGSGGVC